MIYNTKNHSLYYENFVYTNTRTSFFLTIDMLEFDLNSKKLKIISGYLPLNKAKKTKRV
jgi:hypothetical protein